MFRINPARLVYLKFRATIASGIAGNNVPTVAIVIPVSEKIFSYRIYQPCAVRNDTPSDRGSARGVALSTEKQDINRGERYLVLWVCPKMMVRHRVINL
jgi:hypothetical protein